jgi:hypothetical protein
MAELFRIQMSTPSEKAIYLEIYRMDITTQYNWSSIFLTSTLQFLEVSNFSQGTFSELVFTYKLQTEETKPRHIYILHKMHRTMNLHIHML